MPRREIKLSCENCGSTIKAFEGQVISHAKCERGLAEWQRKKKRLPRYVEVKP